MQVCQHAMCCNYSKQTSKGVCRHEHRALLILVAMSLSHLFAIRGVSKQFLLLGDRLLPEVQIRVESGELRRYIFNPME